MLCRQSFHHWLRKTMDSDKPESILRGYRVLDMAEGGCMMCGKTLGNLGADVIMVEPPCGSPTRSNEPFYHDTPDPEKSLNWLFFGLNRRGITLNLNSEEGRDIFRRLVRTADFVIESFEPGYMARLGLGYSHLNEIKPGIIMTSITPFGQSGPYSHYKATDIVGVALSGMMSIYGEADRAPLRISAPQFYMQGGLQAAVGTMVAHYYRELTGEGQLVDQSCQQAIILTLMNVAETWDLNRTNIRGHGPGMITPRPKPHGPLFTRSIFPCKDGYVLTRITGSTAGNVASTKALVDWANQNGYMTELKDFDWSALDAHTLHQEDSDHMASLLEEFLKTRTKAECLERAVKHSIMMVPVNDTRDVLECPQMAYRGLFQRLDHPELGQGESLPYPGFPVMMNGNRPKICRRAPGIGEHNEAILGELGITSKHMFLLKARGII